jgi:hypothetical protein
MEDMIRHLDSFGMSRYCGPLLAGYAGNKIKRDMMEGLIMPANRRQQWLEPAPEEQVEIIEDILEDEQQEEEEPE